MRGFANWWTTRACCAPTWPSAEAKIQAARAQVRAAQAAGRPTISLTGTAGLADSNSASLASSGAVGIRVSIPLFTGYRNTYDIRSAEIQVEASQADRDQLRNQVSLDVWRAYQALATERTALVNAEDLLQSALESENVARGRYKAGAGTLIDLLNAQSAAAAARFQSSSDALQLASRQGRARQRARHARPGVAAGQRRHRVDRYHTFRATQMNKPNLSLWVKLSVVLLLLAGAGAAIWLWRNNSEMPAEQRYRTRPVERGMLVQSVSANGTLNPVVLVTVGSQISARVTKLYADFNQRVKAGQVLAELDPALLIATEQQTLANLASARASLKLARANEERFQQLFAQEYISRQEMDQAVQVREAAQAQVQVFEAQHSRDRANLHYTVIRSPVSGVVVDRQVDVGQTVAASLQAPVLFKIAQDLKQMQINSAVAEADVGAIRIDQEVDFRVDAFPDREFKGKVKQIRLNPTITSNVVTYNVVVSVDNPDEILLPGMTAYITITTQTKTDVLMVPSAALRFRPATATEGSRMPTAQAAGARKRAAGAQVYVLRGGKIEAVTVQTGITNGRVTEITGGNLREGDMVVLEDLSATPRPQTAPTGPRTRLF